MYVPFSPSLSLSSSRDVIADEKGFVDPEQKTYEATLQTIGHVSQIVEQLFQRTKTAAI